MICLMCYMLCVAYCILCYVLYVMYHVLYIISYICCLFSYDVHMSLTKRDRSQIVIKYTDKSRWLWSYRIHNYIGPHMCTLSPTTLSLRTTSLCMFILQICNQRPPCRYKAPGAKKLWGLHSSLHSQPLALGSPNILKEEITLCSHYLFFLQVNSTQDHDFHRILSIGGGVSNQASGRSKMAAISKTRNYF